MGKPPTLFKNNLGIPARQEVISAFFSRIGFAEELNPFELLFINSFARGKPCGKWTKLESLKAGRDSWTTYVSPNGKLNSETFDHWIEKYRCPEVVPSKYIPTKAVS